MNYKKTIKETSAQANPMQIQDSPIYFCERPDRLSSVSRKDLSKEKMETIRRLHQRDGANNLRILLFLGIWIGLEQPGRSHRTARIW